MKLIIGLGNPGRKYQGTRHNIGFDVLAELHRRFGCQKPSAKFDSEVVEFTHQERRALLLSPLTYMNNSGRAVKAAADFYKLSLSDLIVVCDDFNLELGRIRFRVRGSSGGQKGLQDIIERLGSQEINRLRIGIGLPPPRWEVSDYVLSRFRAEEIDTMADTVRRAADGVLYWMDHGIESCMNRFNADPDKRSNRSASNETSDRSGAVDEVENSKRDVK